MTAILTAPPRITRWTLDLAHSRVSFAVRHLTITDVRGGFKAVTAEVFYDAECPEQTEVRAEIEAASVDTWEVSRDAHLRSPDFFDVERYPSIRFRSRAAQPSGPKTLRLIGDLTVRGLTREIELDVSNISAPTLDPWGKWRVGAGASATLSRSAFGMTFASGADGGDALVGDDITIFLDLSLVEVGRDPQP